MKTDGSPKVFFQGELFIEKDEVPVNRFYF
jgi:hypothetical protein